VHPSVERTGNDEFRCEMSLAMTNAPVHGLCFPPRGGIVCRCFSKGNPSAVTNDSETGLRERLETSARGLK